jgi:prepilin-type N-terminal cleavage/methylation domain-containing protein
MRLSVPRPVPAARPAGRHARAAGFSMVEVMLAIVVLAVTSIPVVQGMLGSVAANSRSEQRVTAGEAARSLADRIAATPVDEILATWGEGGTEGSAISILALDGSVITGRVHLVLDETGADADMKRVFGLPRDLDGDGSTASIDVSATVKVLPVLIELTWGPAGRQESFRLPLVVLREPGT